MLVFPQECWVPALHAVLLCSQPPSTTTKIPIYLLDSNLFKKKKKNKKKKKKKRKEKNSHTVIYSFVSSHVDIL